MANVFDMTLEELQALPYTVCRDDIRPFNGVVIVPAGCKHESGYGCMKFVLVYGSSVAGVISGDTDLAYFKSHVSVDLLPKSNCVRVFINIGHLELRSFLFDDRPVFTVRSPKCA